ncbi:hypothetical protein B0H19DRAFT_1370955 [Mycena capillaripes]|nr:hypothetical protein B0H19DRAFT_1370955 [Mycena capillaripes]
MDLNFSERLTPDPAPRARDTWYFTRDIDDDIQGLNVPEGVKGEIFAIAYEYIRCVIPHYTNRERYLAFMRIIIISIVAEFNGTIVDVLASDHLLGYSVPDLVDTLFRGSPIREIMERELHTCILFMAEKASSRRDGELFRRYANCLADSPKQWFRMRDCDGLSRFTIMAALACNDVLDVCFSEEQLEIFGEISIGITLYDTVAFYKHRSEGECREVLWALDAAWAGHPSMLIVPNVLRIFGGAIHMLMRPYRFVDENLTIGVPETEEVVSLTRANFKLWYRLDAETTKEVSEESVQRYKDVLAASEEVLFPGLARTLETAGDGNCDTCISPRLLCDDCRASWRHFLESFPDRAAKAFPELGDMYTRGIPSTSGNSGGILSLAGMARPSSDGSVCEPRWSVEAQSLWELVFSIYPSLPRSTDDKEFVESASPRKNQCFTWTIQRWPAFHLDRAAPLSRGKGEENEHTRSLHLKSAAILLLGFILQLPHPPYCKREHPCSLWALRRNSAALW